VSDTPLEPRLRPLVLVIDDSATYRAALSQTLRDAGYDVESAKTGDEGLRAAARLRPDVMVVDRVLPDIDGTAVIRDIRLDSALRRTPCVLITADEDRSVEFEALETGADAYVRKDQDLSVLLARVAALRRDTPARTETASPRQRRRIMLIAPGSPAHLDGVRALPGEEYETFQLVTARAAAEELAAGQVTCAVIVMSNRSASLAVLDEILQAARAAHVPILAVQDVDDAADAAEMLRRGADDYVSLVDGPALYAARLHALIRRKETEREERQITQALHAHETAAAAARVRAELAEQESEYKERFLAVMSHELRTPLNAILGFTQMLDRGVGGELNPMQRRQVAGVVRSAEHLLALANDVLDLSRIRAGKMSLRHDSVALQEIAENARLTVEGMAVGRKVDVTIEVPPDLPPVWGDAVRLRQILYNLLSNGIKFTPQGGRVQLTAAVDTSWVCLSVRDSGIGIRRDDFGRLFRDFERLEDGQSQQAEGTGLGLALTKHLVSLHGGRIEVESEVGRGSCFRVWLPIAAQ
jgi:signal transduction histidine kinase